MGGMGEIECRSGCKSVGEREVGWRYGGEGELSL